MDRTPKSKYIISTRAKREKKTVHNDLIIKSASPTPVHLRKHALTNSEYSPDYIECTQGSDDVDVVWDWNSPQSKPKQKCKQKRLNLEQSPKLTIKRCPSNNQIQTFDRIKGELEALRNEIVEPKIDEIFDINNITNENYNSIPLLINKNSSINDMFNESVEEQLFLCTQTTEQLFEKTNKPVTIPNNNIHLSANKTNENTNNCSLKENFKMDDWFDNVALEAFKDEDFELLSQVETNKQIINSPNELTQNLNNGKSFRYQFKNGVNNTDVNANKKIECVMNENATKNMLIEKNFVKEQEYESDMLDIRCSPEEIEQKRLNAIAKLDAKKEQELIERNKREALKRLEINRKKRNVVGQKNFLFKQLTSK